MESRSSRSTSDEKATPIFPATICFFCWSSSIRPINAVVVVFPFVPVTAIIGAGQNQLATSNSLTTLTPRRCASCTTGTVDGMPGLITRSSASSALGVCLPVSYSILRDSSSERYGFSRSPEPLSLTNTEAPLRCSRRATAAPLRAAPSTVTCFPATVCFAMDSTS